MCSLSSLTKMLIKYDYELVPLLTIDSFGQGAWVESICYVANESLDQLFCFLQLVRYYALELHGMVILNHLHLLNLISSLPLLFKVPDLIYLPSINHTKSDPVAG